MDLSNMLADVGASVLQARERAGVQETMGDDGIPYCKKCGEPLWLELKFDGYMAEKLGATRYVPRNCECMARMFAEEERDAALAKMREGLERRRRESIREEKLRKETFAKDDGRNPKLRNMCRRYVEKWREMYDTNMGLALVGSNEGGKTYWACSIANALIDEGASVLVTTLKQLIVDMTANFGECREDVLRKIRRVDFLIIDDLGFERSSEYSDEHAFEIINARYNAERPLIVTANLTKETILNPGNITGGRVYSRVKEMCPAIIEITGKYRSEIAQKKRRQLAAMLSADE